MKGYGSVDPLITEGLQQAAPFDWSDLVGRDPAVDAFFADAAEHGIGPIGISIPCTSLGAKIGLVSLSSGSFVAVQPAAGSAYTVDGWVDRPGIGRPPDAEQARTWDVTTAYGGGVTITRIHVRPLSATPAQIEALTR